MKNKELEKKIPVELDDDVLEKIGGGGVREMIPATSIGASRSLSTPTALKNLDQEKTGFSLNRVDIPDSLGAQITPQILGRRVTDLGTSTPSQGENSPVRELVSIEDLIANMANGNS